MNTPLKQQWQSWPLAKLNAIYEAGSIPIDPNFQYILELNYGPHEPIPCDSFKQHSKVSSRESIRQVIQSAISGIETVPYEIQQLPFKAKPNHQYWQIRPNPKQWAELKAQQSLGVYLPRHIAIADLKLIQLGG